MSTTYLNDLGIVCALGLGKQTVTERLLAGDTSGLVESDAWSTGPPLVLGAVREPLSVPPDSMPFADCRNNRLILTALQELRPALDALIDRYGAHRVGVVMGTSTSGMEEAETAMLDRERCGELPARFHYRQMELGDTTRFVAEVLGLRGVAYTVSTACSSGAKALSSASRLLELGVCDAVLAGGADSLCRFTVAGFSALEAVSMQPCNPFSLNRNGINIGEGAALFIVSREPAGVALLGVGESSDGYHMSAPDPKGEGARAAMCSAMSQAGAAAADVGYLNLHGTATAQNDAMEAAVVRQVLGPEVACSSTKPLTGHTLGAAGAIETGLCWLVLHDAYGAGSLPPHVWDGVPDPALDDINLIAGGRVPDRKCVLSNSFAFGGSNACVALGKV